MIIKVESVRLNNFCLNKRCSENCCCGVTTYKYLSLSEDRILLYNNKIVRVFDAKTGVLVKEILLNLDVHSVYRIDEKHVLFQHYHCLSYRYGEEFECKVQLVLWNLDSGFLRETVIPTQKGPVHRIIITKREKIVLSFLHGGLLLLNLKLEELERKTHDTLVFPLFLGELEENVVYFVYNDGNNTYFERWDTTLKGRYKPVTILWICKERVYKRCIPMDNENLLLVNFSRDHHYFPVSWNIHSTLLQEFDEKFNDRFNHCLENFDSTFDEILNLKNGTILFLLGKVGSVLYEPRDHTLSLASIPDNSLNHLKTISNKIVKTLNHDRNSLLVLIDGVLSTYRFESPRDNLAKLCCYCISKSIANSNLSRREMESELTFLKTAIPSELYSLCFEYFCLWMQNK